MAKRKVAQKEKNAHTKQCFRVIQQAQIKLCKKNDSNPLTEITDQHIQDSRVSLANCLIKFQEQGYNKCPSKSQQKEELKTQKDVPVTATEPAKTGTKIPVETPKVEQKATEPVKTEQTKPLESPKMEPIKATANDCLKHFTGIKALCTKESNTPIKSDDIASIKFSFDASSNSLANDCYDAVLGHQGISPCTQLEGDL